MVISFEGYYTIYTHIYAVLLLDSNLYYTGCSTCTDVIMTLISTTCNYFCLFPTHKGVLSWLDASEPSIVLLHLPADDFHGIISATAIGINVVSGI